MMNTFKVVISYFTSYNSQNYENNLHKSAELSNLSPTQTPRHQFLPLELMTHKLRSSDARKSKLRKFSGKKPVTAKKSAATAASNSLSSSCVCLKRHNDSFKDVGHCSNLEKDIDLCTPGNTTLTNSQMLCSDDDLPATTTIGKSDWANGISQIPQPHCRTSAKQNLKQISDSVVLANNGASCTNYNPVTHLPCDSWVRNTQKGLYTFPNYKCPSAQSLTKRNGCDRQSTEDCGVSGGGGVGGGGGQVSLLAALNVNQEVKSIIPPVPPAGSKNPAVMDEQSMLVEELHQLENEEEKHLRRMMHIDSSDDCTTLTRLFFQETSIVHGVARAAKVSSDYRRILWIILVLCSFSGFTLQTCSLLIDFFDWPVSVVTQMEDSRTLTFPAISICNMNKIKSSLLDNTRFASLYQLDKYAEEVIPSALSQYLTAKNETDNLLVCNKDTEWSCPGVHQCIPIEWRCNKNPDCMNGADEEHCAVCSEDFWELKCPGVEECMKVYDFCDGVFQCSDGSDEAVCNIDFYCPEDKQYSGYLYQCQNTRRCIELAWLGDGMDDCGDGEDEDPMALTSVNDTYPDNMVACGNDSYQHIMAGWECDGYPNCANGYDELNCQQNRSCHHDFYLCEEGYSCIVDNFLCDDFLDCVNGSDEKFENCAQRIDCEEEVGLERCERSTYCIPPEWACNGFSECLMDEDENKFKCADHQCLPGQIRCSNGSYPCIYEWQFCDGIIDCPAIVDEINCPPKTKLNCSEENGRVACADNSRCIKKEWRCDGYQDCDTPVDERDCDVRVTCDDMKDDYKSCSRWAQSGYCEIKSAHYTFMKDHCARTCQFCIKTQEDNENILGDKSDLVSNRQWRIYYDTSKHEDYSDVVDLGMMTRQEIKLLGHQQDEFIIQCTFDGKTCSKDWFKEFQNDMYGNCWTFNDGSQNTESLWNISQAGVRHALQLTVFLDVANYLGILSHRTGARLSIQDPRVQPFPDELGITLTPGKHTSIGVRQQTLSRQTGRYGNCIDNWPEVMGYLNHTGYEYSYLGCSKVCIQEQLMAACGCVDSLLLENVNLCNIVNSTQDSCRKAVYDRYQSGEFGCECSQPCEEMVFTKIVSESTWPNTKYMHHMIRRLLTDESYLVRETTKDFLIPYVQARIDIMQRHKTENADADKLPFNDTMYYRWFEREMMEMLRMNFLRVEVYFETLSYERVREQPQYGWEHLLSNIGGALGLWLGLSIITVFEFCELIFDLHRIIISSRYKKRQVERKRIFTLNYRQRNAASLKQMNLHPNTSLV